MHQPGARHQGELRIESEQRVLQRAAGISGAGMHDHARGLVDDEKRAILVDHRERLRFRRDALVGLELRCDLDLLAPEHPVLRAQPAPVHQDGARLDPALKACAGILWQGARQRLIEPQARGIPGQHQGMRAELAAVR